MVLRESCPSKDVPTSGGILLKPTAHGHIPILSLTICVYGWYATGSMLTDCNPIDSASRMALSINLFMMEHFLNFFFTTTVAISAVPGRRGERTNAMNPATSPSGAVAVYGVNIPSFVDSTNLSGM